MKTKILQKLIPLAPVAAQKIAKMTDGKKTVSGLILTTAGIGCLFIPVLQGSGIDLLIAGVPLTITGLVHKFFKHKKKGKNNERKDS